MKFLKRRLNQVLGGLGNFKIRSLQMNKLFVLYEDISNVKLWTKLCASVVKGDLVVINPDSGPGSAKYSDNKKWDACSKEIMKHGGIPLAYVDCYNAVWNSRLKDWVLSKKSEQQLKTEINLYFARYPILSTSGFFIDDYPNNDYSHPIYQIEKSMLVGKFLVANYGDVPTVKSDTLTSCNVSVCHETNGIPRSKPRINRKTAAIVMGGVSKNYLDLQSQGWDYGVVYKNKDGKEPFLTLPI